MNKKTKENVFGMLCIAIIILLLGIAGNLQTQYRKNVVVTKTTNDMVYVIDDDGHKWAFLGSGYYEGNILKATFWNNDTVDTIEDDYIIKAKFIK